ncbi:MAG: hypothetical protein MJA82_03560 [Clostridia bacterium]|nr:hypothetical protein [Clostridia bacterium]
MISNKFKLMLLTIILIFSVKTIAYASSSSQDTIIEYDITEDATEEFIDTKETDLEINTKKQFIRLSGEDIMSKIKFTNGENSPVAYSVMTGSGVVQYAFDGEKMVEIDSLEVEVDNPLAYAARLGGPDVVVAVDRDEDEKDIMYYSYGADCMIENPFLSINGLTEIRSMVFINENDLAVLNENEAITYKLAEDGMIDIPSLRIDNLENPIDIASRNNNLTILEEDKIRQFEFNGTGYSEIPALTINFNEDINARAIAVSDSQITVIDDEKAYTYLMADQGFSFVKALSVTEGLTAPASVSVHQNKKDIIILDKEGEEAKIKYFSFSGADEGMIEVPGLSVEIEDVLLGNISEYALKGELVTKPLDTKDGHINLIQIGAYSYLEENTSITIYISQSKQDDEWMPMWKLERKTSNDTKLYKNENFGGGGRNWIYKGDIDEIFPPNLNLQEDVKNNETDFEVIKDDNGDLQLNPSKRSDEWFEIPVKDLDSIKLKMKFESENGESTPYVYVPYKDNEINKVNDEDDIAIKIVGRRKPESPIIDDINDGMDDLPGLKRKKGWVYSTTPTIKWKIPNIVENENYQSGCQLVIMARKNNGWKPAIVTKKISGNAGERREYTLPTSKRANIKGPLFDSESYQFAAFVRVWDIEGRASDFSIGKKFNVLAYERPRITNIVSTPDEEFSKTVVIKKGMEKKNLPLAMAGTAITLTIDSVGPIENDIEDGEAISKIFYQKGNKKIYINQGEITSENSPGSSINTWDITFWTDASVLKVPEETIIRAILVGDSHEGGTTVFCIPRYAEGVARIKDTVYTEWNVFLKGSGRD